MYKTRVSEHPRFEIVAIVDPNDEALARHETKGVLSVSSLAEAVDNTDADAVIINSPTSTHVENAEYALHAKLHVLCAKPGPMSVRNAYRLRDLSEDYKRVFKVDYTMLNAPEVDYLHGLFGVYEPMRVSTHRVSRGAPRREGAVWDLLSHDVALILDVFPRCLVDAVRCEPIIGDGVKATFISDKGFEFATLFAAYGSIGLNEDAWLSDREAWFDIEENHAYSEQVRSIVWSQTDRSVTIDNGSNMMIQRFKDSPDPISIGLSDFYADTQADGLFFYPLESMRLAEITNILSCLEQSLFDGWSVCVAPGLVGEG